MSDNNRSFLGNPTTRVVLLVLGIQTIILFFYCNQRSSAVVVPTESQLQPKIVPVSYKRFKNRESHVEPEETTTVVVLGSSFKPNTEKKSQQEVKETQQEVSSEVQTKKEPESKTESKTEPEDPYEATNNYWVNHIKGYCSLYKEKVPTFPNQQIKGQGVPSWVWMDSPKHELFYCAAPKCSSTTWKSYLLEDLGVTWKGDVHGPATRLGAIKPAQKAKMDDDLLGFLDTYRPENRFLIVRNPWARLVSAYENKMIIEHWTLGHLCVAGSQFPKSSNTSFKTFMECLAKSDRSKMWNSHIHPYTSLCALCHMDYNIIVKLEEMDKAEPFIRNLLHFTSLPNYTPPAKGIYSNTYASHYSDIDQETITALRDIYKDDIELFDYPRSPFD